MSATIDVAAVSALLGGAPIIQSAGRMFAVALRYRPPDPRALLEDNVARAIVATMREEPGSALVFLPGAREIERVAERLRIALPQMAVHPLYGALDAGAQDAAIAPAPAGARKIVLATALAETSLTIDGVRIVIDAGLSRRPRFEPGLGLARLETVRASQAAVTQRAGRAGRTEPGLCVRLWEEGETRALPAFDRPEILDADLAGLVLDLARWGITAPSDLAWLDAPPRAAWEEAVSTLRALAALDDDRRLTPHGAQMQALPLPPRLAHMLTQAGQDGALAAHLAVLLTEQGLGGRDADVRARLARWRDERSARAHAARGLAKRLARDVGARESAMDPERCGGVLALGFPDRVAKARGGARPDYLMANGRAASLDEADPLAREAFLVIADATGRADRTRILAAAPMAAADVDREFAAKISVHEQIALDLKSGAVRGRRVRRLGRITLSEAPLAQVSAAVIEAAMLDALRDAGIGVLPWDESATQLRARVAFLRSLTESAWPDWSDTALTARLADWLPADGARRLADFEGKLHGALLHWLDAPQRAQLERETPTNFTTPAGSVLRIDYGAEGGPAIDVRLQELFGLGVHPCVAAGRAPLTIRLLSPAGRPVQTTKDLPGFWRGSYAAVRADMRGRYPKHPWPDDPMSAPPTKRAKPRSGA